MVKIKALMMQKELCALEHQDCHLPAQRLLSEAHVAQYGTVTKIGLILCPMHLSFRWSTIPLSVFLFLYNEGP